MPIVASLSMPDHSRTADFDRPLGWRSPVVVETQRSEERSRVERAYRAGRLICGCVHLTISVDERLGLTQRERRRLRVRFDEPLDDGLRRELTQLARRRGAAAHRVADRLQAIELVADDAGDDEPARIIGCLQPPQVRHGRLRDIEFGLRELERAQ
jgi:hypothetical protein